MGKPQQIKTDSGPGYTSQKFKLFCQYWDVQHIIGIPYNPTGQAIIEWSHHTLKQMLKQNKGNPSGIPSAKSE